MEKFLERLLKLIDDVSGGNVSDFANKSGIKQPTLHKYVKGRLPSVDSLYCIRNNLDVNINWLLTGDGQPYQQANSDKAEEAVDPGDCDTKKVVLLEHIDIVKDFVDYEGAKEANSYLRDIERIDPIAFREMIAEIRGFAKALKRMTAGGCLPSDSDELPPNGENKRSGKDRRSKVG